MIASPTSWRFAGLAAVLCAGLLLAFARGAQPVPAMPAVELPPDVERIDDGLRADTLRVHVDRSRGVLEDTPVTQPRHDRGF